MKHKRLTKKQRLAAVQEYAAGETMTAVAAKYGVSPGAIRWHVKRNLKKKTFRTQPTIIPAVVTPTVVAPVENRTLEVARAILFADLTAEAKVAALRIVL